MTQHDDFPPELTAQLSALPEGRPADFKCAICGHVATNKWNDSPRDYERPPICMRCEHHAGYMWNGRTKLRTMPKGGTYHDKRQALRIGALADAISDEATQQTWSDQYDAA